LIPAVKAQVKSLLEEINPYWNKGIDLGCGRGVALPILRNHVTYLIGVDYSENELKFAKDYNYDELVITDVRNYEIPEDTNVVFLFDVIEHLHRQEGIELLSRLQKIPSVIITTPGRYFEDAGRGQRHVSLWNANDFRKYGYNVEIFRAKTVWIFTMSMILAYRISGGI